MLYSIPKVYDEDNTTNFEEFQFYAEAMSKHHQKQYQHDVPAPLKQGNRHDLPPQHLLHNQSRPRQPFPHPPRQTASDYYLAYENVSPSDQFMPSYPNEYYGPHDYMALQNGAPVQPQPLSAGQAFEGNFHYMHQSSPGSAFSRTSSMSSPRMEHSLSVSSLPSNLSSPYAKDPPDMLTAMRNRTRAWSVANVRHQNNRTLSQGAAKTQWNVPYEPQMGFQFSAPNGHEQEVPMPSNVEEFDGVSSRIKDMHAAAAAAAANSYQHYGEPSASLPPASNQQQPQHRQPDRNGSYASIESDRECYSPTYSPNGDDDRDEKRSKKSAVCPICSKVLKRDLTRHMRTHEQTARFICPFPRSQCPHKRGQFNRPYDFKKHLLHHHFLFDKAKVVRKFRDLQSKLSCRGSCPCGQGNFMASEWLDSHILGGMVCPLVQAQQKESEMDTDLT